MLKARTYYEHQHTDQACLESAMLFITATDKKSHEFTVTPLKYDRKASVMKINHLGKEYVLKHYHHRNLFNALRTTRAMNSWHYARKLSQHNISTPKPLALIEKKWGPFKIEAFFITEAIEGEWCYHTMRSTQLDNQQKKSISNKIKVLLDSLKSINIVHGDMKASNIIISHNQPYLIDLDAMRKKRPILDRKKDYNRFMKNWPKEIIELFFS